MVYYPLESDSTLCVYLYRKESNIKISRLADLQSKLGVEKNNLIFYFLDY